MSEGRVIVVTGAASGIGRACARRFAAAGDRVAALDVQRDALAELAAGSEGVLAVPADVADPAEVAAAFARLRSELGPASVLVAAAGISAEGDVVETDPALWRRVLDVSLTGTYLCSREAVQQMRERGGGAIVTFGSVLGRATLHRCVAYTAAKGGVEALTRALALDGAAEGIRANCVLPGSTDTPLMWGGAGAEERERIRATVAAEQPAGRIADPDEIAACVQFLASPEASFVSGASLVADGGLLSRIATSY